MFSHRKPDWNVEGRDWPNRAFSRFVEAGGLRWHVQIMGQGPALLLLHGTGAASHSWRDVAPLLAETHTVIIPDLPAHGFSATPKSSDGLKLPGMARAVTSLLAALALKPDTIIGHSAGAAIALRMSLDSPHDPPAVIAINGAIQPFPGIAAHIFPVAARLLFLNPLTVRVFAGRGAEKDRVRKLMQGTGSNIDDRGLNLYARLMGSPGHIEGVLGMMAHWDLLSLARDLPKLKAPLTLIVGENDRAVPPTDAEANKRLVTHADIIWLPGLGHLAHEEDPAQLVAVINAAIARQKALS